jgi:hypothetical protein
MTWASGHDDWAMEFEGIPGRIVATGKAWIEFVTLGGRRNWVLTGAFTAKVWK